MKTAIQTIIQALKDSGYSIEQSNIDFLLELEKQQIENAFFRWV